MGQLVGLPFCAIACDHLGRRATLIFGAFFMLVGVALQAGAQNSEFTDHRKDDTGTNTVQMVCSLRLVEF